MKSIGSGQLPERIGIALDEPERLDRLRGTNRVSLLKRYGITEQGAFAICKEHDLLSPIYGFSKRGGCWFCPNQSYAEFARLKMEYPELWEELRILSKTKNLTSDRFKYSQTFAEVERRVDMEIANWEFEARQQTLFNFL